LGKKPALIVLAIFMLPLIVGVIVTLAIFFFG
jgi:hypothetical protein